MVFRKSKKRALSEIENCNDKSSHGKRKKSSDRKLKQTEKAAKKLIKAGNYQDALEKYTEIIDADECNDNDLIKFKVKKAICLVNLRRFDEASSLASEILREYPDDINCLNVLGRCCYEFDIEKSIVHFEKALSIDPGQKKEKTHERAEEFIRQKKEANDLYCSGDYAGAYDKYQAAFKVDPANKAMRVVLLFNMAQASYKMNNHDTCLLELNEVLSLKPDYVKALLRRAQCYLDKRKYEEALEDLDKAVDFDKSGAARNKIAEMLREAKRLVENAQNDLHGILGLRDGTSWEEINKAYRKLIRENHPDKHSNGSEEEKQFRVARSKEITRAYRILKEQYASGPSFSASQSTPSWQEYSQRQNYSQSAGQYQNGNRNQNSSQNQSQSFRTTPPKRRRKGNKQGPNDSQSQNQNGNQNSSQNQSQSFQQSPPNSQKEEQSQEPNSSQTPGQNRQNSSQNRSQKPNQYYSGSCGIIFMTKSKPAFTNYVPRGQPTFHRCAVCSMVTISKNGQCSHCNAQKNTTT